jgi:hypothetical protein
MKTAIAAESGNIQGMTERYLAESGDYLINRINQKSFNTRVGEDPIKVRYSSAPIEEREYVEILVQGDEEGSMNARSCGGQETGIATTVNRKGAYGCNLPGQSITGGYDTFGRVLKGKAYETEPICAMDLLLKEHYNDYIRMLRGDLPKRAVEQFQYSLERNVIDFGQYNTSCVNGFVYESGMFPAIPEGTLDLGVIRRMFQILRAQGWTGAQEVTTSQGAFEIMRLNYKRNTGLELQTTLATNETQHLDAGTQVVDWAGIRWVLLERPLRGYIVDHGETKEFVPVRPIKARAGSGGGVVADVNEDWFECSTYCDGQRHELFEVGFYVHPTAATRESFAMPQVADKTWSQNLFNFEVKMIDGAYIDCNTDNFKFFFRMLHAYGFESLYPELMGACIYRVQPDIIYVNTVDGCQRPDTDPLGIAAALPQQHNLCSQDDATDDCSDEVRSVVLPRPTQLDPSPDPVAGSLRFVSATVVTETDAGTVKVWVERIAGGDGAASVILNTSEISGAEAQDGTDFADIAPTTLSWADGEAGRKSVTITILPGGAGDVSFNVDRTSPTGAAWVGPTTSVVEIDTAFDPVP